MKKHLLLTAFIGTGFGLTAQMVQDSVEMLPGYTNESYYSLSNDEQANVINTNWDIAFDLSGFGATIRANEHTGTETYVYPNGTDWSNVDTTGMAWNVLHNGDEKWSIGAFNKGNVSANPFDLGWGIYSPVTHHITGDSIHILKLASGAYKKLMIESLAGGVYTFKHADLNGANEVSATVTKGDYTDKNFAYYSIDNDVTIDREPANNTWDIVFTKYVTQLSPGTHYGVTGVLSNNGVYVREASGVDPATAVYTDYTVDSVINVVGWDWKSFNMGTFMYDIEPDLSYFIQDLDGNIWHLVFTRFEGTSTGKIVFAKELVSSASLVENEDISSFGVYPNPADDKATIVYNSNVDEVHLTITNINGAAMHQQEFNGTGFNTEQVNVSTFPTGVYFVRLSTAQGVNIQRLVIR